MSGDDHNRDTDYNSQKLPREHDDTPSTTDDKGNNSGSSSTNSLASRIQNSASGLARNAFFAPGSSSADLARTLASGNKGGAAVSYGPSGSSSSAEMQRGLTSVPSSSAAAAAAQGRFVSDSFRSYEQQQKGAFDLPPLTQDEFQNAYSNDHELFASNQNLSLGTEESGKGKGKQGEQDERLSYQPGDVSDFSTTWQSASSYTEETKTTPTSATDTPLDGAAVVSLLSDKSFDPEFALDPDTINTETDLLPPAPLTKDEIEMIDSFRRRFTPQEPPQHHQQQPQEHRLTSFSLIPDIGTFLDSVPPQIQSDATSLRDAVLSSLPGAADWIAVEERYHDEVWGYLRPTLEAAKKEIEENESQGDGAGEGDGPAVRRLKMVLRHMGGSF